MCRWFWYYQRTQLNFSYEWARKQWNHANDSTDDSPRCEHTESALHTLGLNCLFFFRICWLVKHVHHSTNTILQCSVISYCHLTIVHWSQSSKMKSMYGQREVDFGTYIYEMFGQVRNVCSFDFLLCIIINAHFGIMDCEF